MSIEEQYELFEAYLDNSLTASEKIAFETLMQDPEAKAEFETYKAIQNSYIQLKTIEEDKEQFKQQLQHAKKEINNTGHEKPVQLSFVKKYIIPLSAAAAILIGLFLVYKPASIIQNNNNITEFIPDELSNERGMEVDSFAKIVSLYNEKKYTEAMPMIDVYLKSHPENVNLQLAKAICFFDKKEFAVAEKTLQDIIAQNNSYKEKAQWYLINFYAKQGKTSDVKSLFQSIDKKHFYYQAMMILANK